MLERAASTDPDAVVAAIRKTSFVGGVTVSSAMLQILGQAPRVVWPRDGAEQNS